jgi:hypothetical protein
LLSVDDPALRGNFYQCIQELLSAGALIESGPAVRTSANARHWKYVATETIDHGTAVNTKLVATDRPGGAAIVPETKQSTPLGRFSKDRTLRDFQIHDLDRSRRVQQTN